MKQIQSPKTRSWLAGLGKMSAKGNGEKLVALALAAATTLDADSAKAVMGLVLSSPKIGLRDKAAVKRFKRRLAELAPAVAAAIGKIPDATDLRPRDVAAFLNQAVAVAAPVQGTPAIMVKSASAAPRRRCADDYGKAFGEKASDRFIGFLYGNRATAMREAIAQANPSVVLEFTAPTLSPEQVSSLTSSDTRARMVAVRRDAFYAGVAPLRAELEKSIGTRGRESALDIGSATDVCWLDGSLRAVATPMQIADVAGDASLIRIGLPRFLARELSVTNETVGASAYRVAQRVTGLGVTIAVLDGEVDPTHTA